MDALSLKHVTKQYHDFTLQDITLALPEGCILGLAGENGAGKSTTIRLIMDAISRDSGEITVLGTDNRSPEFLHTKEDIGVVLDEAYFPESMTAKQVGGVMKLTFSRWDSSLYESYLSRFALPPDKLFREYSRGMRMKLAIAVALSHAPKLLILDEATSGLDPIVRDEILDIFFEYTRDSKHTILLSSHILSDLEKVCDYVAFMHKGRLLMCDEKDHMLEEFAILQGGENVLASLPADAVISRESGKYGSRALVRRSKVPAGLQLERADLENILLFMVKGEMY